MTGNTSASGERDHDRSRPWVSVVIPTFNGARFIRRALSPLVAANDDGLECIVVDDGSTDDTRRIVDSYREALRLRVEEGPRLGNWVASTNTGVKAAEGEYVTFLHQDDEWLPSRLNVLRRLVRAAPQAALYVHAATFLSASGRAIGRWSLPLPVSRRLVSGDAFVERLLIQNFLCVGAPLFRRSDLVSTGGLDEELWYTADWDLWLRLALMGDVAYDARPLVGFRIHGQSQTATRSADLRAFRWQLEEVFERHFPAWACSNTDAVASAVERASRASIELNVTMAALSHRKVPPMRSVAGAVASLGIGASRRLLRDSRLYQRLVARLIAMTILDDGRSVVRSPSCP